MKRLIVSNIGNNKVFPLVKFSFQLFFIVAFTRALPHSSGGYDYAPPNAGQINSLGSEFTHVSSSFGGGNTFLAPQGFSDFGSLNAQSSSFSTSSLGQGGSGLEQSFSSNSNSLANSGDAQVFKHLYVHVAPEDPDDAKLETVQLQPVPKQIHYRIIFIKPPSPPNIRVPVVAGSRREEKTLVYVLVKKPIIEEVPITRTELEQVPQNKPEVYFINYMNKANGNVSGDTSFVSRSSVKVESESSSGSEQQVDSLEGVYEDSLPHSRVSSGEFTKYESPKE